MGFAETSPAKGGFGSAAICTYDNWSVTGTTPATASPAAPARGCSVPTLGAEGDAPGGSEGPQSGSAPGCGTRSPPQTPVKEPRHLLRAATQPQLPACAGMRSWGTLQARLKEPGFTSDRGLSRDEELGNPQIGGMEPGPPQTPVKELRSLESRGLSGGDGTAIPPQTWACPGVMQLGSPLRHRQSIRDPSPT